MFLIIFLFCLFVFWFVYRNVLCFIVLCFFLFRHFWVTIFFVSHFAYVITNNFSFVCVCLFVWVCVCVLCFVMFWIRGAGVFLLVFLNFAFSFFLIYLRLDVGLFTDIIIVSAVCFGTKKLTCVVSGFHECACNMSDNFIVIEHSGTF